MNQYVPLKRIVLAATLACACLLIFYYNEILYFIISYVEMNFSPDRTLNKFSVFNIKLCVNAAIIALLSFCIIYSIGAGAFLARKIRRFFELFFDLNSLWAFASHDGILSDKSGKYFLIASSICSGAIFLFFQLTPPTQEGPIELFSNVVIIASSLTTLICINHLNFANLERLHKAYMSSFLIFMFFGFLFIVGEEISWGQRIFKWDSQGAFATVNFQSETNIHNFFNPAFSILYPTIGSLIFIFNLFFWKFPRQNYSQIMTLIMPPKSFIGILYILALSSGKGHSEAFETILYIFFLFYALRMLLVIKGLRNVNA